MAEELAARCEQLEAENRLMHMQLAAIHETSRPGLGASMDDGSPIGAEDDHPTLEGELWVRIDGLGDGDS